MAQAVAATRLWRLTNDRFRRLLRPNLWVNKALQMKHIAIKWSKMMDYSHFFSTFGCFNIMNYE